MIPIYCPYCNSLLSSDFQIHKNNNVKFNFLKIKGFINLINYNLLIKTCNKKIDHHFTCISLDNQTLNYADFENYSNKKYKTNYVFFINKNEILVDNQYNFKINDMCISDKKSFFSLLERINKLNLII